ncbi:hypothetical protein F53441_11458 [Fusarium austroafricanum]|uniref:Sulfotransferase domain-containing protein n=1 Tax=Fusarium austroafricanum TaxID=2364996 RepID=A0A8H4K461_9HYPO|nr:hypothetical protein F53441_11458 [Fusarium austroafricanum]
MSSDHPSRILLISQPRTACHLLERMLSDQPNVSYASHPFVFGRAPLMQMLEKGPFERASAADIENLKSVWEDGFRANWQPFFAQAAEQKKTAFMHFHPGFSMQPQLASAYVHDKGLIDYEPMVLEMDSPPHTNPTVIPDKEMLAPGTVPVLTIRHPALMIPSSYRALTKYATELERAGKESIIYACTFRWQRLIYDFYNEHGASRGIEPLIVDADDWQGEGREAFMNGLCAATGLEVKNLLYTWPKASEAEMSEIPWIVGKIKQTILGSVGVIEGLDSKYLDMEKEALKWKEEFGEDGGAMIQDLVARAMDDYQYLKERKFTRA